MGAKDYESPGREWADALGPVKKATSHQRKWPWGNLADVLLPLRGGQV
jgi:hypothetical protein